MARNKSEKLTRDQAKLVAFAHPQECIAAEQARAAAKLRREEIFMAQCFLTGIPIVVLLLWILMP